MARLGHCRNPQRPTTGSNPDLQLWQPANERPRPEIAYNARDVIGAERSARVIGRLRRLEEEHDAGASARLCCAVSGIRPHATPKSGMNPHGWADERLRSTRYAAELTPRLAACDCKVTRPKEIIL